ncbi:hypothetical protein ACN28S_01845 [Cystobacter fuscus]
MAAFGGEQLPEDGGELGMVLVLEAVDGAGDGALVGEGGPGAGEGGGASWQRGQVSRGKAPGSAQVRQRAVGSRSTARSHVSQKAARTGITFAQAMHAGG